MSESSEQRSAETIGRVLHKVGQPNLKVGQRILKGSSRTQHRQSMKTWVGIWTTEGLTLTLMAIRWDSLAHRFDSNSDPHHRHDPHDPPPRIFPRNPHPLGPEASAGGAGGWGVGRR